MAATLKCPICEQGDLILNESRNSVEIDGKRVDVPFRAHSCAACGVVQGTDDDLRFNARAMRKSTKEVRGLLTGEQVRNLRQRLCLTQEQAAALFGGGPVAFSKYENDEISQSEAMDRLIWLAGENPWVVGELATRIGLTLSSDTSSLVQRSLFVYQEEYMSLANELVLNARVVFDGFSELQFASNDEKIYLPNHGARTELRKAA